MTKLILIRHGETDYTLEKRYCGVSDPPLNETGVSQAQKLYKIFKSFKVSKVYSSDLERAYQFASITFKNNEVEQVPEFREINFGKLEGLDYKSVIAKFPDIYENWTSTPAKIAFPEGESLEELNNRVTAKLPSILSGTKTIALVSHGGPIRIILCHALGLSLDDFWQVQQDLGALNIVDFTKGLSGKVLKMNDTSYLK